MENIVHLVLARLPDAPEGSKGISLFLVPKFLPNPDGSIGERNPIFCGAIEEKMVDRIGGRAPIPVDVRVVAATNRDLRAAVESGEFRRDLFFRLAVFPVEIPPLRARAEGHQDELWRYLRTNDLSVVSTDHCPFCYKEQKELGLNDFSAIPNGSPSPGTTRPTSLRLTPRCRISSSAAFPM